MKAIAVRAFAFGLFVITGLSLRAELIFVGTWPYRDEVSFLLVDSETARQQGGRLGSVIQGYTLVRYDADSQELWLAKDGDEFVLRRHQPAWKAEFTAKMMYITARQTDGALTREQADAERGAAGASSIVVLGAAYRPGSYWFQGPCTLGEALIEAGGLGPIRPSKRLLVTRLDPQTGERQKLMVDIDQRDEQGNHPGLVFPL